MSQAIFQSVLVIFGILFQVLITSFIQPMGFKLNWVLMILIILAFLHGNRLIPFLAIFAGIWCDLMSHGMVGVYGISFLFVILVTQWISTWFYSHTLLLGMIVFFTLSLFEGFISLTLLKWSEEEFRWGWNFLYTAFPQALIHGIVGPLLLKGVLFLESLGLRSRA